MVGTEKYSSEQILFILQSKDRGIDNRTIAEECRKQWRNRQFEPNGIKYVWTKHKKSPEYIGRSGQPVFATAGPVFTTGGPAPVPGLSPFRQQALASYINTQPTANMAAEFRAATNYQQAHPNNTPIPSTPYQHQQQIQPQAAAHGHQAYLTNVTSTPSLHQQQAHFQAAARHNQANSFASPTMSSLQRQKHTHYQGAAQSHHGNPTNTPSTQQPQQFRRQDVAQHHQSQSVSTSTQSAGSQIDMQQAQRQVIGQYANAPPAIASRQSATEYQFQHQGSAQVGRGGTSFVSPSDYSAQIKAHMAAQFQTGKPLGQASYGMQQEATEYRQAQPGSAPNPTPFNQSYQMQSHPQNGIQYQREQPSLADATSSSPLESTEFSAMTQSQQMQPAAARSVSSITSQSQSHTKAQNSVEHTTNSAGFKAAQHHQRMAHDLKIRQARELHNTRQMQQASMSHNSMSQFNPNAVNPQGNTQYRQAPRASAFLVTGAYNVSQQQMNPQVMAQYQQKHRGNATTPSQPQVRRPSPQVCRIPAPDEDLYEAQREFMRQIAKNQPPGNPSSNRGPAINMPRNDEQHREQLFAQQRALLAKQKQQAMPQSYTNNRSQEQGQTSPSQQNPQVQSIPQFQAGYQFQVGSQFQNNPQFQSAPQFQAAPQSQAAPQFQPVTPELLDAPLDNNPLDNASCNDGNQDDNPFGDAHLGNSPLDCTTFDNSLGSAPLDNTAEGHTTLDNSSADYGSFDDAPVDDDPYTEEFLDAFFATPENETESIQLPTPSSIATPDQQVAPTRVPITSSAATPERKTQSTPLTPPTEKKRKEEKNVEDEPAAKRQQPDALPSSITTPDRNTKSTQLPTPPTEKRKAEDNVEDEPAAKRQQSDTAVTTPQRSEYVSGARLIEYDEDLFGFNFEKYLADDEERRRQEVLDDERKRVTLEGIDWSAELRFACDDKEGPEMEVVDAVVKDDTVKKDAVKKDTVKEDGGKSDAAKDDIVKKDIVKKDTIKNDTIKEDTIKNDTTKNDTTKKDTIKKDTVKKDGVREERTMTEEEFMDYLGITAADFQGDGWEVSYRN